MNEIKRPKSIDDPTFGVDDIGWCEDISKLYNLDRGTVFVPDTENFKYVGVLRKTRLELEIVENPYLAWREYQLQYTSRLPEMKKDRLEFIKSQRGTYYKDLGIHPLACIGDEGMGYEWDEDLNKWLEFPQYGGVKIGSDVRIGAFTSIKKATLEGRNTIIGDGCKIGSHCNIGHNVELGRNCLLTHRVSIGGSAIIGERVYFGQGSIIRNKVTIGEGCIIGQGANVLKDVPPYTKVIGVWK